MDAEIKESLEGLGKAWKEYRETNDKRLEALEKGQGTSEINAKLENLDKAIVEVKAQINRAMLGAQLKIGQEKQYSQAVVELTKWMRSRQQGQFKAEVNTTVNTEGGYIVLPEIDGEIGRVAGKTVALRGLANVRTIGRQSYIKNMNLGATSGGWATEGSTRSEGTATPKFAQIEIFARELYAQPAATNESLEDIEFDVAAWLAEECGLTFADLEDAAYILGDGVGKPKGFLAYGAVANASYAWGKLGYIASGAAADFASSNPSDRFIDLIHALKTIYRGRGTFLMNDTTLSKIRKFKDGQGNYLWQPSFQADMPDMLLGKPLVTSDNMPDVGADAFPVAFGDFKTGYQIVDRRGVLILADPYTVKGSVSFYTSKRTGGDVVNFEAIKLMKIATS
jgi:HK97 family phage major capsid protein